MTPLNAAVLAAAWLALCAAENRQAEESPAGLLVKTDAQMVRVRGFAPPGESARQDRPTRKALAMHRVRHSAWQECEGCRYSACPWVGRRPQEREFHAFKQQAAS